MGSEGQSTGDRFGLRHAPQQQRAKESVDRVLEAAAAVLVDEPENLTITEIGRRSGVSKGTVYRYFPDVASIVQTLALPYVDRAVDRVGFVLSGIDDPMTAVLSVNQLLDDVLAFLDGDPIARAIFITCFNRLYIGDLYNEGVHRVAACAIENIGHILNEKADAHPRLAAMGVHLARSLVDLTDGMEDKERQSYIAEYRTMMFRAADVNLHRPTPLAIPDAPAQL